MLVLQKGLILPVPMYGGSYFFIQPMNTFIESNKGKHFTLSDRISIEAGIEKGWSFKKLLTNLARALPLFPGKFDAI